VWIVWGIGLLEHVVRVVEGVSEYMVRWQIDINDVQFGFLGGGGTAGAIFAARRTWESFGVRGRKLCFGFVDLEKAFDRVPGEVVGWAMRGLGVGEWLVSAVVSMCTGRSSLW